MKKSIQLAVFFLVTLSILSSCSGKKTDDSSTQKAKSKTVNIATASIGGAFYPIGQEISNLVSKYTQGISMTPEVTGGAVENPRLIDAGDADFGITNANVAYAAAAGTAPYTKKMNIMAVGNLHPSVFHIITLDNSDIHSIADLKGKKIAVGPAGGGTLPILEILLKKNGLELNDIVPSYLSYSDGFSQLSDGNVDVALALAGYPTSSVMEISATKKIRFISISKKVMDEVSAEFSYYSLISVPKESYGLDEDASALGINNVLIVNKDMDDETVYQVTKAIYANLDEFGQNNATAKQIDIDSVSKTSIALHPGAKKYFAENK